MKAILSALAQEEKVWDTTGKGVKVLFDCGVKKVRSYGFYVVLLSEINLDSILNTFKGCAQHVSGPHPFIPKCTSIPH